MPKGVCTKCGSATWHPAAKLCKTCYIKQLQNNKGPLNHEWGRFTSQNKNQGWDRAKRRFPLGKCERCHKKPAIDRHHVDGNPLNNTPSNVQRLCRSCHMIIDGRMKKLLAASFKKKFRQTK